MKLPILTVRNCALLTEAEMRVLETVALYTDRRTGFASVSLATLAMLTRMHEKSVRRVFDRLSGPQHDRLLHIAQRPRGAGAVWLLRPHWERLQAVADAVCETRRRIGAGCAEAVIQSGLWQAPAGGQACAGVIAYLRARLTALGWTKSASKLGSYADALDAAMAGWPDKILTACGHVTVHHDPESLNSDSGGDNPDSGSVNPDSGFHPPTPPIRIYTPRNSSTRADTGASPAVDSVSEQADEGGSEGRVGQALRTPVPSALALAGLAGGSGKGRIALSEALVGARIGVVDGVLLVRCADAGRADFIQREFGASLVEAALGEGFSAVMVTVRASEGEAA